MGDSHTDLSVAMRIIPFLYHGNILTVWVLAGKPVL
jgi:hypothetical protein